MPALVRHAEPQAEAFSVLMHPILRLLRGELQVTGDAVVMVGVPWWGHPLPRRAGAAVLLQRLIPQRLLMRGRPVTRHDLDPRRGRLEHGLEALGKRRLKVRYMRGGLTGLQEGRQPATRYGKGAEG